MNKKITTNSAEFEYFKKGLEAYIDYVESCKISEFIEDADVVNDFDEPRKYGIISAAELNDYYSIETEKFDMYAEIKITTGEMVGIKDYEDGYCFNIEFEDDFNYSIEIVNFASNYGEISADCLPALQTLNINHKKTQSRK